MERNPTNVLRVHREILKHYKECEEKKESDENIEMKTPKTVPVNEGIQLFTLLPVKSCFTMSNILIDKTAVQGCTLFKEDPMAVVKPFFDIKQFETGIKKIVNF